MKHTTNKNLKLPEYTDVIDIADINENFEIVDEHLGEAITSDSGTHGCRYNAQQKTFEILNVEGEWEEISPDGGALETVQENLNTHTGQTNNPHNVTKSQVGLGNVENKSSATIRSEITKTNVTNALGYTPPTTNTTYSNATQSVSGLMSAADKKKLDNIEEAGLMTEDDKRAFDEMGVDSAGCIGANKVLHASGETVENELIYLAGRMGAMNNRITMLEAYVCVKADTQILMADGTTKAIKDVKNGEYVKSWDLEKNEYVDVKAYGGMRTGIANTWTAHIFENGEMLEIFENHVIYNKTRQMALGSQEWKTGETALGIDGVEDKLVYRRKHVDVEFTDRYMLLTENSLYFANGILCGSHPRDKLRAYSLGILKDVTEEEVEMFRLTGKTYEDSEWWANREYRKEAAQLYAEAEDITTTIESRKKRLAECDYKTIKRQQGVLSDDEWEAHIAECEECRRAINDAEERRVNTRRQIVELQKKHGLPEQKKGHQKFQEAYAIEMEYVRRKRLGNI